MTEKVNTMSRDQLIELLMQYATEANLVVNEKKLIDMSIEEIKENASALEQLIMMMRVAQFVGGVDVK